jgi:uncharacterized DUF497 family protein
MVHFEWNEKKNELNIASRGISFEVAEKFFRGHFTAWIDKRKDYGEERFVALGEVESVVLVVVFTIRETNIYRIISIRKANKYERGAYRALQERYER